jgi:ketosteroid isomerase-like protein
MSQENMDLVAASIEVYNRGDLDALVGSYAPDVEAFPAVFDSPEVLRGFEEFRRWLEEIGTPWAGAQWVSTEVVAIDVDRVLNRAEWGGEGVASGIQIESSITAIFTVRDGRISRVEYFFDHDEALRAAGLAG